MQHRYVQLTSSYPGRRRKQWNGKLATRFLAHWSDGRVSHGESDTLIYSVKNVYLGFPGGTVVRNPPANAGDTGSSPGPGGSHMLRSN